jgi:hypothetical protein
MEALKAVEEIYINFLKTFKHSIEENEEKVKDKSVGYHELFAVIYRLERQRIAVLQLKLVRVMLVMWERILNGADFHASINIVDEYERDYEECLRHRVVAAKYLDIVKESFPKIVSVNKIVPTKAEADVEKSE